MIWVAVVVLIGQGLVAYALHRINRTFGAYSEKLLVAYHQNIEIRKNLAIQQNEEAITYLLDHPTEREA